MHTIPEDESERERRRPVAEVRRYEIGVGKVAGGHDLMTPLGDAREEAWKDMGVCEALREGKSRRVVPEWSVEREAWMLALCEARHWRKREGPKGVRGGGFTAEPPGGGGFTAEPPRRCAKLGGAAGSLVGLGLRRSGGGVSPGAGAAGPSRQWPGGLSG